MQTKRERLIEDLEHERNTVAAEQERAERLEAELRDARYHGWRRMFT